MRLEAELHMRALARKQKRDLASEADLPDRVLRRRVAVLTGREPGPHGSLGGQVALLFAREGPHVELGLETHRGGGCSRDGVEGAAF